MSTEQTQEPKPEIYTLLLRCKACSSVEQEPRPLQADVSILGIPPKEWDGRTPGGVQWMAEHLGFACCEHVTASLERDFPKESREEKLTRWVKEEETQYENFTKGGPNLEELGYQDATSPEAKAYNEGYRKGLERGKAK